MSRLFHTHTIAIGLGLVTLTLTAGAAHALPIDLTRSEFTAQTAGLPTVVEDLESQALGTKPNPWEIANGVFAAHSAAVFDGGDFCGDADRCLGMAFDLQFRPRTFSTFPSGTTFWGTDLYVYQRRPQTFAVTVTGGSGTATFTHVTGDGFWGFADPLGLTSITFDIFERSALFQLLVRQRHDGGRPAHRSVSRAGARVTRASRGWPPRGMVPSPQSLAAGSGRRGSGVTSGT